MKLLGMLSVLVVVFLGSSLCYAQTQEEENVAYEKLKVLEPIIGTWTHIRTDKETGGQTEIATTYSWSATKKMIVSTSKQRRANKGENISAQEWGEGGPNIAYLWNYGSECLEQHWLMPQVGVVFISKVVPKDEGMFELTPIHHTSTIPLGTNILTITETELRVRAIDLKGPQGEKLEDVDWYVCKRVKPAEEK